MHEWREANLEKRFTEFGLCFLVLCRECGQRGVPLSDRSGESLLFCLQHRECARLLVRLLHLHDDELLLAFECGTSRTQIGRCGRAGGCLFLRGTQRVAQRGHFRSQVTRPRLSSILFHHQSIHFMSLECPLTTLPRIGDNASNSLNYLSITLFIIFLCYRGFQNLNETNFQKLKI